MGAISRVFKSATKAVKKVTRGVTKAAKNTWTQKIPVFTAKSCFTGNY